MDSGANKDRDEVGGVETKVVDTVDYQTMAGQGQQKRDLQVIHQAHNPSESSTTTTVAGVVASAASAADVAIQAAKDAVTGK